MPVKSQNEPTGDLRIFLAYQDYDIGRKALETCLPLIRASASDARLEQHIWSFGALVPRELRSSIMQDAAEIDMLIIASHGDRELPGHVKHWLHEWAETHMDKDIALVGVVDQVQQTALEKSPCLAFLSAMSRHSNTRFFAKSVPASHKSPEETSGAPASSWGINE